MSITSKIISNSISGRLTGSSISGNLYGTGVSGMGTKLKYRWSAASAYYNDGFNSWTLIGDVST